MSYLIKPKNYKPLLDLKQTELGIKQIKEFFQLNLSSELRLRRVTAPLFVLKGMGINDDLNGIERPVSFPIKDLGDAQAEVVHSLAKWKRLTLADYHIEPGYGIYTDMNAIRSDEELGNLHSLYVDQWDWERVITDEDRNVNFLKEIVNRIYAAMIRTEYMVYEMYPQIKPCLPQKLHFIHSEELRQLYPNLEPKCREHAICQKYGAVFIIGIGCQLGDGKKHDGRAPDYDDYTTKGLNDLPGLNGDLLLWDNVLQRSIELSSMGIRVDKEALQRQLKEEKTVLNVTVKGIVSAGVIAYVEGIRGFIPASKLSLNYVEDLNEYLNKEIQVQVFDVEEEDNRLILSARELLREKAEEERRAKVSNVEVGLVTEGTVESLQPYGAFVNLGNGLSGLVHISQISEKRIKHPSAVLAVGDKVKLKVIAVKDGKLSLSMKALQDVAAQEIEEEVYELPETEEATTTLGSLFANIKLS